jgi:hypothetical protein
MQTVSEREMPSGATLRAHSQEAQEALDRIWARVWSRWYADERQMPDYAQPDLGGEG